MRKLHFCILLTALCTLPYGLVWGQTSGTLTITTSTTLTEDHNGNIVIAANRVTLDCAGHAVTGDGSGSGIELIGRTGASVANCRVTNFQRGVFLQGSRSNIFMKNEVSNNAEEGFEFEESDANILVNNRANKNDRDGFDLDDSHGNIFIDQNEVTENGLNGIELDRSNNNVFIGNTANNNGRKGERSGFSLDISTGNFFRDNTANNNTRNGLRLDSSSDNTFTANQASGNEGRDRGSVIDGADCKQIGLSIRNQFLPDNQFSNPDQCVFRPPGD